MSLRASIIYGLFAITLMAQVAFWWRTHEIIPDMGIVPDVPGVETVKALSFGDEQGLFRLLALNIQNAGDTFGRFTALYKYDYFKLYHWFRLLDRLDNESHYVPSMATYYFGQTQRQSDLKYIYDYLVEHSADRPEEKWWWLVQASYIANHKLNDKTLALKAANHLKGVHSIPLWAQQTPAFIYEQRGEMGSALSIIEAIMEDTENIEQGELNFMRHFVDERLKRMEEVTEIFEERQRQLDTQNESSSADESSDEAP